MILRITYNVVPRFVSVWKMQTNILCIFYRILGAAEFNGHCVDIIMEYSTPPIKRDSIVGHGRAHEGFSWIYRSVQYYVVVLCSRVFFFSTFLHNRSLKNVHKLDEKIIIILLACINIWYFNLEITPKTRYVYIGQLKFPARFSLWTISVI